SLDTRRRFTVPVHAQDEFFQVIRLGIVKREPDMRKHSRAICIKDGERVTGLDGAEVGVAAGGIRAGNSLENVVLRLSEADLPLCGFLSLSVRRKKQNNSQHE